MSSSQEEETNKYPDDFSGEDSIAIDDGTDTPVQVPWWRRIFTKQSKKESFVEIPNETETVYISPSITMDDVRTLLKEELALTIETINCQLQVDLTQVREEVSDLVQAELDRKQETNTLSTRLALWQVADKFSTLEIEYLRVEQDVFDKEILPMLQDNNIPLRERLDLMDKVGEYRTRVMQRINKVDSTVDKMQAYSDKDRAENNQLQEPARRLTRPSMRKGISWLLGPGSILITLLLIVVVGVAGILLPSQARSAPYYMVELADLFRITGDANRAIELLDKSVEAGIRDNEMMSQVGLSYYDLEQYEKAIEILKQALEIYPNNEEIRRAMADSYKQTSQHQQAIEAYNQLVEIDPTNWQFYIELGMVYEDLQEYDQALIQYQKGIEIEPNRIGGYISLGDMYLNLEQYELAIDQYQRAVELSPDIWWIHIKLGQSHAAIENWDQALEQFRATLELKRDNPEPFLEIGKVLRAQGEYEEALNWYEDALEVSPNYISTLLEIGDTYRELGDCGHAVPIFLRIFDINPNNQMAREGLETCQGE